MTRDSIPARPPFDDLPLDRDGPAGNAWGLYGPDDELGSLNLLTPEVVKAAASEIMTGERVSLDWHLDKPARPSFDRPPFEWTLRHNEGRTINDDTLYFNTQCSSQWDGFRHFGMSNRQVLCTALADHFCQGYQGAERFYNNRTQEDIENTRILGIDG